MIGQTSFADSYRAAACIGYYWILPVFINFQVVKCIEIMARFMKIQTYESRSHKVLPLLEVTITGNKYCKGSITNVKPVSKMRKSSSHCHINGP